MAEAERNKLIKKIEDIRGSKVITYITSDRPNILTQIDEGDLREFFNHIMKYKGEKIDLFLYSQGGATNVPWALTNIIKEYASEFCVLIPYRAFSAATLIALGADNIVMTKTGFMGPVDPSVWNQFNPLFGNQFIPISVEDVSGYQALLREKFGINDQANVSRGFEILSNAVHPLALGNVYRQYLKSRDDVRKIIQLHLNPTTEKEKIDKIVEVLVEKLYYHGHHINRKEAAKIGLNIQNAENFSKNNFNLTDVMWDLYKDYEEYLQLLIPYRDELPSHGNSRKIPIKCIESSTLSSSFNIEQSLTNFNFPAGSIMVKINNEPAVYIPGNPPQIIPLLTNGRPIFLNSAIYDKEERLIWSRKTIP